MTERETLTTRGKAQKEERRRRNTDALSGRRRRLGIREDQLNREEYAYYWARSDQLDILTREDDWEVVQDREGKIKPNSSAVGAEVSVSAGVTATGAAEQHVLLRKLKKYQDEDAAVQLRRADEIEAGMKRDTRTGARPDEGMSIGRE